MLALGIYWDPEKITGQLEKITSPEFETQILDEGLALMLNRIRTRFLSEKDPDGVPWTPSEAGKKRRSQGGTGTLFDTGTLFHSIQAFYSADTSERIIGTDVYYAKYLQKDLSGPWVFLGFGAQDLSVWEKLVYKRIAEVFNG